MTHLPIQNITTVDFFSLYFTLTALNESNARIPAVPLDFMHCADVPDLFISSRDWYGLPGQRSECSFDLISKVIRHKGQGQDNLDKKSRVSFLSFFPFVIEGEGRGKSHFLNFLFLSAMFVTQKWHFVSAQFYCCNIAKQIPCCFWKHKLLILCKARLYCWHSSLLCTASHVTARREGYRTLKIASSCIQRESISIIVRNKINCKRHWHNNGEKLKASTTADYRNVGSLNISGLEHLRHSVSINLWWPVMYT